MEGDTDCVMEALETQTPSSTYIGKQGPTPMARLSYNHVFPVHARNGVKYVVAGVCPSSEATTGKGVLSFGQYPACLGMKMLTIGNLRRTRLEKLVLTSALKYSLINTPWEKLPRLYQSSTYELMYGPDPTIHQTSNQFQSLCPTKTTCTLAPPAHLLTTP
jgi:hypothetical protein